MHVYAFPQLVLFTCLIVIKVGWSETLPNGDDLLCLWTTTARPVEMADCEAAIRMIPGPPQVSFNPSENITKPINLELDQNGGRDFRLPAAFVAGTCSVAVYSIPSMNARLVATNHWRIVKVVPSPPRQAATLMSFLYWPKVKEAAGVILQRCLHQENKIFGQILTKSVWNGEEYHASVRLGSTQYMHQTGVKWNIYQSKEVSLVTAAAADEKSRHGR